MTFYPPPPVLLDNPNDLSCDARGFHEATVGHPDDRIVCSDCGSRIGKHQRIQTITRPPRGWNPLTSSNPSAHRARYRL